MPFGLHDNNHIERFDINYIFGRGPLKEHFCNTFVCNEIAMNANFYFPTISLVKLKYVIATKVLKERQ